MFPLLSLHSQACYKQASPLLSSPSLASSFSFLHSRLFFFYCVHLESAACGPQSCSFFFKIMRQTSRRIIFRAARPRSAGWLILLCLFTRRAGSRSLCLRRQETGQKAQRCHQNDRAGNDSHGELHGSQLRRPEHAARRRSHGCDLHGLSQLQQQM